MSKPTLSDIVILYDKVKDKKHIINLSTIKNSFSTSKGQIKLEDILNTNYGDKVRTHLGYEYFILSPTLYDLIMKKLKRSTQIVYPKDAVYIAFRLDIKPGNTIIEAGVGSGAASAVFLSILGEKGKLISYEIREEFINNALKNLKNFNLDKNIEVKHKDIVEGFDEKDVDAIFLDVKEPWFYLENAIRSLKSGKMIGIVVPTTNQVSQTIQAMQNLPLIDIEISEIIQRFWKTNPDRLRPTDTMSAHTTFLIFGRKVNNI